jgi:hypothetical protein
VNAEIARDTLEASAAKVRGKPAPILDKVLTSDQYDTWEHARYDLKFKQQSVATGRSGWCRGIPLPASLETIYKQWIYTGTI